MDRIAERTRDNGDNAEPAEARARSAKLDRSDTRERIRSEKREKAEHALGRNEKRHDQAEGKKPSFFRRPIGLAAIGVVLLLLIGGATLWWLDARNYESTDDAFIDARIVRIAPQIAGQIAHVYVEDNQLVQPGQLLLDIDSADARTRVDQAVAQEMQAESQIRQARSQISALEASRQQALSSASAVQAQAQNAARDLARYRQLAQLNAQAVDQQQLDQAEANARNTAAQAAAALKQAQNFAAQRGGSEAQVNASQAQVQALKAQVDEARITLGRTRIYAPVAGHIAQRTAAVGNFVQPGQQMMTIVPLQIWVTANFKETQLATMRVGQPVDIEVDACPNAAIRGRIDSIQRGAGQAFGLLPPENATGNYIKVVQRVPVKIALENVPSDCPLGPGMSVVPTIKVR